MKITLTLRRPGEETPYRKMRCWVAGNALDSALGVTMVRLGPRWPWLPVITWHPDTTEAAKHAVSIWKTVES